VIDLLLDLVAPLLKLLLDALLHQHLDALGGFLLDGLLFDLLGPPLPLHLGQAFDLQQVLL